MASGIDVGVVVAPLTQKDVDDALPDLSRVVGADILDAAIQAANVPDSSSVEIVDDPMDVDSDALCEQMATIDEPNVELRKNPRQGAAAAL